MKNWIASYYRKPTEEEIGPILVTQEISGKYKTAVIRHAKEIAKERDWRYLDIKEKI